MGRFKTFLFAGALAAAAALSMAGIGFSEDARPTDPQAAAMSNSTSCEPDALKTRSIPPAE